MNLRVVNHASLSNLVAKLDLMSCVKTIQIFDNEVDKIKGYLAEGKSSCFSIPDDCALYFKGLLFLPSKRETVRITGRVMKKCHDTSPSIHPGRTKMNQDIRQTLWWSNMK